MKFLSFSPRALRISGLCNRFIYPLGLAGLLITAPAMLCMPPATASASPITFDSLVSPVPAATTPHALGEDVTNRVLDITQAGKYMFYSGNFNKAANPQKKATISCGNLIVQNLANGATTCPVLFDNEVTSLYTLPGNKYVYAGGKFSNVTVKGKKYARKNLVKIVVATMTVDPSFDAKITGHSVSDLQGIGDNLIVAGDFATIRGVKRPALASVLPATGALTQYMNVPVTGVVASNAGLTSVDRVALSPLGNRAMIIGNFIAVGGKEHYRAASLLLSKSGASVSDWNAPLLKESCKPYMPSYTRDIDFSPDGTQFVLGTTGGMMTYPLLCDTVSAWNVSDDSNAQPHWIDYAFTDTIQSVLHTGTIVYAGGHERAHNAMLYVDGVRQAVPTRWVSGMGALNAATGEAYAWGAGRDRGEGVKKLLAVTADAYHSAGIYVGNDTEWWYDSTGARVYNRERIAFLPAL